MTEIEIWHLIADAEIVTDSAVHLRLSTGQCGNSLYGLIGHEVSDGMLIRLIDDSWPLDHEGMVQRKQFARKMIELEIWQLIEDAAIVPHSKTKCQLWVRPNLKCLVYVPWYLNFATIKWSLPQCWPK